MSAEIDKAIEILSARIMELARENATLREELAQAKGVERRALDVEEIAKFLGVSRATVDRWILKNKIPVFELPLGIETPGKRSYRNVRAWNVDLIEHFRARPIAVEDEQREEVA